MNGKIRSVYVGDGVTGDLAALIDATGRSEMEQELQAVMTQRRRLDQSESEIAEIDLLVNAATRIIFEAAGFHRHRGQWRKRNGINRGESG